MEITGNRACEHFEAELNAFVDGELKELHLQRVVTHLDTCESCRFYVEQLRAFAQMHRDSCDPEKLLSAVDAPAIFQNITAKLLAEKIEKLSDFFYQLGKTYVLRGAKEKRKGIRTRPLTRPIPIDKARQRARRLFLETNELSSLNGNYEKVLKRAKSFFRKGGRVSRDRIEVGRRFLEESLAINSESAEPRIYLGFSYMLTRRYDKSREQFGKVLTLSDVSVENRMIAFQNLGYLHVLQKDYAEAVSCFREVEKSGIIEKQPRFYTVLTSLAMAYAKSSDFEKSIECFDKIVKQFPKKVTEIRKEICSMETFQNLLRTQQIFRQDLQEKIPALFAS